MTNPILQFFEYKHLPTKLQGVSAPFQQLAYVINEFLPENAEKSTALRKLLEAKDCAVRALIFKPPETEKGNTMQDPNETVPETTPGTTNPEPQPLTPPATPEDAPAPSEPLPEAVEGDDLPKVSQTAE